MLTVNPNQSNP